MVPQVSIVIPTYNRSALLQGAIESCYRSASGIEVEIIVVDDGSTEDICCILAQYNKVRCIRVEKNIGSAAARNLGKSLAVGSYVKFLDSDDVLIDDSLRKECSEACRCNADIVISGWQEVVLSENGVEGLIGTHAAPVFYGVIDDLLQGKAVPTSSALYQRVLANSVEWDSRLSKLNDWDFFIHAALAARSIASLPQPAYRWRHHGGRRITSSASFLENAREFFSILETMEAVIRGRGEMSQERERRLAQYLYKELRGAYRFDPALGKQVLQKILSLDPEFAPRDEERSRVFRWLCRLFPIHPVLSVYSAARRAVDRL